MNSSPLPQGTGSLFNLAGPDLIIIFLILGMLVAAVLAVVGIVVFVTRRGRRPTPNSPPPLPVATSCADRIEQLDELRKKQLISELEYEEQRRRILSGI
jgi:predicted membrane protein